MPKYRPGSSYFVLTSKKKSPQGSITETVKQLFFHQWLFHFSDNEHLVVVSGVFCRCRNKELLQEDGLRVGGTVYGEGSVWIWNGLNLDDVFIWTVDTDAQTHTIYFISQDNILGTRVLFSQRRRR